LKYEPLEISEVSGPLYISRYKQATLWDVV